MQSHDLNKLKKQGEKQIRGVCVLKYGFNLLVCPATFSWTIEVSFF